MSENGLGDGDLFGEGKLKEVEILNVEKASEEAQTVANAEVKDKSGSKVKLGIVNKEALDSFKEHGWKDEDTMKTKIPATSFEPSKNISWLTESY